MLLKVATRNENSSQTHCKDNTLLKNILSNLRDSDLLLHIIKFKI